MQIILVSGRLKTAKTLTIMPRHVILALVFLGVLVFATSAAFSWLTLQLRLPLAEHLVQALQRRESEQNQEVVSNNLRLMATRLGELQATVLQLDNLGERLSTIAGIRKDEPRDSEKRPGQGGPFIAATLSAAELQKEIDRFAQVVGGTADDLAMLESHLLEKRVRDRLLPTTLPVREAELGSPFGYRLDPFTNQHSMHEGLDFGAPTGTPVVAAAAGVVAVAENRPDYGNMIDIDHGDGLVSRYAHLSRSQVRPGQIVRRGETIGAVGSTGRSTGPHLHFEVRMLGVAQNPLRFFRQNGQLARAETR